MDGSALLLNKIVKAVVERVVKEMQSKEYKLPGGFLVKVLWSYLDLYFASEQVLLKTSKVYLSSFVLSLVLVN